MNSVKLNSKKIKSASMWSIIETLISTCLILFSIILLARILSPEDYGLIATAQFIAGLIQIFLSLGINEIIIQKKDLDKEHIQTLWTAIIFLSFFGFLVCLCISFLFFINDSYVISKILIFEGMNTAFILLSIVPTALLMKDLQLKSFTLRIIISRLLFFLIAIPLALSNYGLWSIVYASLAQNLITFIMLFLKIKKQIPEKLYFNITLFKESMNFGFFVMVENLLWSVLGRVLGLLVAIFHGSTALGVYNMASKLTDMVLNLLNSGITRITLPIFSAVQDDKEKLLYAFQASTYYFNIISLPIFFVFGITATYWVPIVLGGKWVAIIPLIQIISFMYAVMYTRMFVGVAIRAIGKSKDFLILSLVAASLTLVVVFFTKNTSVEIMLIALALSRIVITIPLGSYLLKKICGFSLWQQFEPLKKPFFIGFTILLSVYLIQKLNISNSLISLIIQILVCCLVFLLLLFVLSKLKSLKWK